MMRFSAVSAFASVAALLAHSTVRADGNVAVGGDPYDYKELTVTAASPVEIAPGLFDFGKDGIGWLELHDAPKGAYAITIGEMTNAGGRVANPYPGSTIRCQTVGGWVDRPMYRFRMPADPWNLIGYDIDNAPAIALPKWAQIVFPFRYAQVRKAPAGLKAENLVRKMVHYPIDMGQSSFKCDNAVLNGLYDFFKYSILATSFCGVYVDGDRERTPYEADAYINQLCQYAIDADYSLARKSHEWLMEHPTWPTEWKQHSIMIAWADWMWTGDTRSIAKYWKSLSEDKLLSQYARPADGLLLTGGERQKGCVIPDGGDIVDWPPAERDGFDMRPVNGVINAFHYRNLVELSQMAAALGKSDESRRFLEKSREVRDAYRNVFLNPETGLFVDGEGSRHSSLHVNAAAVAFGLAEPAEMPNAVAFLEKKGLACSVYFAQYLLEAFCKADRADIAVRLMASGGKRSWKAMMDFGSTISMEAWNMEAKPNQDLNHAWGSVPLNIISRFILGVTPMTPGFGRISIAPQPGGLKKIAARVPTAKGVVSIEIDGARLTVGTPAPSRIVWRGKALDVEAGAHSFD